MIGSPVSNNRGSSRRMARVMYCSVMHFAYFFAFVLIADLSAASDTPDGTKTVEFNVKPGGVLHTFSETIVSTSNNDFVFAI